MIWRIVVSPCDRFPCAVSYVLDEAYWRFGSCRSNSRKADPELRHFDWSSSTNRGHGTCHIICCCLCQQAVQSRVRTLADYRAACYYWQSWGCRFWLILTPRLGGGLRSPIEWGGVVWAVLPLPPQPKQSEVRHEQWMESQEVGQSAAS